MLRYLVFLIPILLFGQSTDPNILLWMRADCQDFIATPSGAVSEWSDYSLYGHDFAQATADNQPIHSGVGINFATNDLLSNISSSFWNVSGNYTLEIYFRTGSDVTTAQRLIRGHNVTVGHIIYISGGNVNYYFDTSGSTALAQSRVIAINTTYYYCITVDRSGNMIQYLNNVGALPYNISALTGDLNIGANPVSIGGQVSSTYFTGIIYEIRLSAGIRSEAERTSYYTDLQSRTAGNCIPSTDQAVSKQKIVHFPEFPIFPIEPH